MGTPEFAVAALRALIETGHEIAAVYTQPPRPAGRGYGERLSPVHALALSEGIEVRTPLNFKGEDTIENFRNLNGEAAIVAAYGLLLPKLVLDAPRHGCFNIHASLLPRWRGAAPIQRAIMAGDTETGVTIMKMEEGLDTGPVCRSAGIAITETTTAGSLHDQLALLGAQLMVDVLRQFPPACRAQPDAGVTYARKISKEEAHIDFGHDANHVRRHIHGLSPAPGAWLNINGTRIKVLRCESVDGSGDPGVALDNQLTFACGNGAVRLLEVQREGKSPANAPEFLRGFPVPAGSRAE